MQTRRGVMGGEWTLWLGRRLRSRSRPRSPFTFSDDVTLRGIELAKPQARPNPSLSRLSTFMTSLNIVPIKDMRPQMRGFNCEFIILHKGEYKGPECRRSLKSLVSSNLCRNEEYLGKAYSR